MIHSSPAQFISSAGGVWAGMRMAEALQGGEDLSPALLRTAAVLRRDEWDFLLDELTKVGEQRLRAVRDLIDGGLVRNIPNAMGVSTVSFENVNDGFEAIRSMSPLVRSEFDQPEFAESVVPNFITHSDFQMDLRKLTASRNRGEALDTTSIETAGRRISESLESALLNGAADVVVNGAQAFGYTNHPNRITRAFAAGAWSAALRTGTEILTDLLNMIGDMEAERFFGPYWLYIPTNTSTKLDEDFKTNSDKTIRERLGQIESIAAIRTVDQLAADNVVLVQATSDVVQLADGEGIQPIQWDITGGLGVNFKVLAIQVPLVKARAALVGGTPKAGVVHMS